MPEFGFMTQLTDNQLKQLAFWILRLRNNIKTAKRPIDSKVAFGEYRGALQVIDILGFGNSYAHLNNSIVEIHAKYKETSLVWQRVSGNASAVRISKWIGLPDARLSNYLAHNT